MSPHPVRTARLAPWALASAALFVAACGAEPAAGDPDRVLAAVDQLRPLSLADSRLELVGLAEQRVERLDRVRDLVAERREPQVLEEFDRLHADLVQQLAALREEEASDWRARVGALEVSVAELESLARALAETDA